MSYMYCIYLICIAYITEMQVVHALTGSNRPCSMSVTLQAQQLLYACTVHVVLCVACLFNICFCVDQVPGHSPILTILTSIALSLLLCRTEACYGPPQLATTSATHATLSQVLQHVTSWKQMQV